jgi:hypothetical protein
MSNSIHFEQRFERFSRFLDRQFRPAGERRRGHGCGLALGDFERDQARLLNLVFSGFVRRRLPIPARAN